MNSTVFYIENDWDHSKPSLIGENPLYPKLSVVIFIVFAGVFQKIQNVLRLKCIKPIIFRERKQISSVGYVLVYSAHDWLFLEAVKAKWN